MNLSTKRPLVDTLTESLPDQSHSQCFTVFFRNETIECSSAVYYIHQFVVFSFCFYILNLFYFLRYNYMLQQN